MSSRRISAVIPFGMVAALLFLSSLSFLEAGVFRKESPESVGDLVRKSPGSLDVVLAKVSSRASQPNQDPALPGTFVTVLEIQGRSLLSQQAVAARVTYLGASWRPELNYGTSAEPPAPQTAEGKKAVFVIEKSPFNAPWSLGGMNRLAPVMRNVSGEEIALSQSPGFFVEKNQKVADLEARIRKAAGIR